MQTFKKRVGLFCFVGSLATLVSGCLSTKRLQGNEKLLYYQTVEAPKGFNKEGLNDLFVQKANDRMGPFPISVGVGVYYKGKKSYSKEKFIAKREKAEKKFDKKIASTKSQKRIANLQYRKQNKTDAINKKIDNGNLFMQWGEPLAVFDTAAMRQSKNKIEAFLFNRGYFKSKVDANFKEGRKKRITVKYSILPGPQFVYDTIFYNIPDQHITELLTKNHALSLINKGEPYDQDKLGKERDRVDQLLKDNGYYDFSKQFIDFSVDTTSKKNKVKLQMEILNPTKRGYHKQFKVDSIIFITDVSTFGKPDQKRNNTSYHNITFSSYEDQFSKKILAQRVFINKDSLYSRTNTFNTQRQLANLDNFKFANVNYDTTGGRFIANLFTSPTERYTWGNEAGVTVTQGFPGPYFSSNFKRRNVFGGLEIMDINGRFGFEGVAAATTQNSFYKSTEASLNVSFTFPQFLFPFRSTAAFRYAKNNPRTKLLAGYTYTDRPEYQRSISTVSATYTWDLKRRLQFSFSPATLNIITSTLDSAFQHQLVHLDSLGNKLINAFKPSYVSSMIFTLTWNNNYGVAQKSSTYARATFESGGTLQNLYSSKFITDQGLERYQYLRASFDFRKNVALTKTRALAFHFNSGFGYIYSPNKVLPYEKNFFAGGSNSVRAWRPRRLGLGADPPTANAAADIPGNGYFNYNFEKPGQLLLEGSVEWRQKLFGFVNYAFFIDAGNVWAVGTTSNQKASFAWNSFYKQFGIGTGAGLRFDFTFLILRFDVGIKAWEPADDPNRPGGHFVLWNAKFGKPYSATAEPVIYNIGIGYPF